MQIQQINVTHPVVPQDQFSQLHEKELGAQRIIDDCIGKQGVWASPTAHRYQNWTRHFALGTMDALLLMHREDVVRRHLDQLTKRQGTDGSIPILYIDDPTLFLWGEIKDAASKRRPSFLLKRYFTREGVERLTPSIIDAELHYAFAMAKYGATGHGQEFLAQHREAVLSALNYLETQHLEHGLMYGVDWRQPLKDELLGKALLSNNCVLFRTYSLLGLTHKAERLRANIEKHFWTGTHYRDFPGTDAFDLLGNAFAIQFDVATKDRHDIIFEQAKSLRTPFGYKVRRARLATDLPKNGVICPFVSNNMLLAAVKAGKRNYAKHGLEVSQRLDGFYEYYDPKTGHGCGSSDQVLSAASFIQVAEALEP